MKSISLRYLPCTDRMVTFGPPLYTLSLAPSLHPHPVSLYVTSAPHPSLCGSIDLAAGVAKRQEDSFTCSACVCLRLLFCLCVRRYFLLVCSRGLRRDSILGLRGESHARQPVSQKGYPARRFFSKVNRARWYLGFLLQKYAKHFDWNIRLPRDQQKSKSNLPAVEESEEKTSFSSFWCDLCWDLPWEAGQHHCWVFSYEPVTTEIYLFIH